MKDAITGAEAVVERIRKALRLARKAATEGEKSAAMAAAMRLAKGAGLDLAEIEGEGIADGGKVAVVNGRKVDIDAVETQLAAWIISRHFAIAVAFEQVRGGGVKVLWIGNRLNIGVAQYAWYIMLREAVKAYDGQTARKNGAALDELKREQMRDLFMRGFFFAVDYYLTRNPLRNDTEQIEAERKAAQDELDRRKREDDFKMNGTNKGEGDDGDALTRGFREGIKVRLARPVDTAGDDERAAIDSRVRKAIAS